MKRKIFFTLYGFVCVIHAFSQINTYSRTEQGIFICKAKHYLIYTKNEEMNSETPTYTINAIDINNGKQIIIDKQTTNKCVNISDTAILYIKGSNLMLWSLKLKHKIVYYKINKNLSIIGISYNKYSSNLLLVQIDFKTKKLMIKILNNLKQVIFCQKININEMEIEGVFPILETYDNFFVLLIQDKLYTVDNKKLEFNFITNRCDGYALNKDEIIYYKFITDEKTEGYSFNPITKINKKIDSSLNEKIYNCEKSFLFTANIDSSFIPTYIICNKSYSWINHKWQIGSEVLEYKDSNLIVKMPLKGNAIIDSCFQWKFR